VVVLSEDHAADSPVDKRTSHNRQHLRLKTFGGWRDKQLADGTVIWLSHLSNVASRHRPFPASTWAGLSAAATQETKQIAAA